MLQAEDLARIQRELDGLSSPASESSCSPVDIFKEPQEESLQGSSLRAASTDGEQMTNGNATARNAEGESGHGPFLSGDSAGDAAGAEDDEVFSIQDLLREKRRRLRRQLQQPHGKTEEAPVSLPAADIALNAAEQRVLQKQQQREKEAIERAARLVGDEVQHVAASGPVGGGSRMPKKKSQQVYVGLPVGVGWHVPLVGVEGRGGYKPAAGEAEDEGGRKKEDPDGGRQKRALTIKEKERLKRKKGQSSHATWKPEAWMQLRQQFD
ncbi:uncharacterized protein LOC34622145 [Cyclospora cayetanensis]|uniref:Uncharacterized protein LOC34622145 n=1 Tax=Cyclospora cayetanensis TaxID=88456 RepID=A0A6P6RQG3_9EIME|nr:uncharacterized protein LOC34622145 [Cyclospora cayetanensis]